MKVLVTGATGYLGIPLCQALANKGLPVRALYRSNIKSKLLRSGTIELMKGDITDSESLKKAVHGCKEIYHLAAFAAIWAKDPTDFRKINVEGTKRLFTIAKEAGVRRIVMTSTAGVMGPSLSSEKLVQEDSSETPELFSAYDRSKFEAEMESFQFLKKGLDVVMVNPSRIYGPGIKGESNSVSRLVEMFLQGKWRFIPGDGQSMGNYVFINDVVNGHLQAMENGVPGNRYILGGTNVSYKGFFEMLNKLTGKDQKLVNIPVWLLMVWAQSEMVMARTFGKKPMIVPEFVKKLTRHWNLSSNKAIQELGYQITDLETGLRKTIEWLKNE